MTYLIAKALKALRVLLCRDKRWVRALQLGVGAGIEHCPVLERLSSCLTVVDAGANRGQFGLAARHVWPRARIIAFEPLARPALTFGKVFTGDDRVTLHRRALGSASGTVPIHISRNDHSSSLLEIGPEQERIFPGTAEAATATIEVARLDQVLTAADIARPALFKLDVQGYEMEALEGASEILGKFDFVYCECSFKSLYRGQRLAGEVIAWLRERGFDLRGVYHMIYDSDMTAVQGDFLFARNCETSGDPCAGAGAMVDRRA